MVSGSDGDELCVNEGLTPPLRRSSDCGGAQLGLINDNKERAGTVPERFQAQSVAISENSLRLRWRKANSPSSVRLMPTFPTRLQCLIESRALVDMPTGLAQEGQAFPQPRDLSQEIPGLVPGIIHGVISTALIGSAGSPK